MGRLIAYASFLAILTASCSSDEAAPERIEQKLEVVDRVDSAPAQHLQRFELRHKSAVATVIGLGADVTIGADGELKITPTPVSEPSGRDVTPGWSYTTRLATWGRTGDRKTVAPSTRLERVSETTVTHRHGDLEVRYEHRGIGLKQDVVVKSRPAGKGRVELAFDVDGPIALAVRGKAIAVSYQGHDVMEWRDLAVFDADGVRLEAHMSIQGETLLIDFDDTDAAYPVTVDPLATMPVWDPDRTQAAPNTNFGFKVRWAGDVDGDGYDDILVSQPLFRGNFVNEGRVLLYLTPNGVPNAVADNAIVGGSLNAFMGQGISAAGDVDQDGFDDVALGASGGTLTVSNEGVVYVHRGVTGADGIRNVAAWSFGSGQGGSSFGSALDHGDFNCDGRADIAIGAGLWDEAGSNLAGKAWVFYGDGSANLYDATPWEKTGAVADARFGSTMTNVGNVNGDTDAGYDCEDLAVSASNYSPGGITSAGRVEIYAGSATGLATASLFGADGTQTNLFFGAAVAGLGDTDGDGLDDVAFGAQRWDDTFTDQGAVFVHLGDATTGLVASPQQTLLGSATDERLGFSVATGDFNGDGRGDVAGSAPLADTTPNGDEGRVEAWVGITNVGIDSDPAWSIVGAADSRFGFSLDGRGDVDGDGFDDLLVGAPLATDDGVANAGSVYLYRGGQTCLIGGVTYAAGDLNPANPCEECAPSKDPTSWAVLDDGTTCADPTVCGASPTCMAGVCTGTGTTCDDGDPCTDDFCDTNGTCQTTPTPDGTICGTDPDPCTDLRCQAGSCDPDTISGCAIDGACYPDQTQNPAQPCLICDVATSATSWSPAMDGIACSDGLFCTVGETCSSGVCGGGSPRDCSSAIDQCNDNPFCSEAENRCVGRPANEGDPCDDGDLCITGEVCATGLCVGTPVDCSNLDTECQAGVCNPADGMCETDPVSDGISCGDPGDACFDGQCITPVPVAMISGPTVVECGSTIELDGSGSFDDRSLMLTYAWTQESPAMPDLLEMSTTDAATLSLANERQFQNDRTFTIGLVVDNGFNPSPLVTHDVTFEACTNLDDDVMPGDAGMVDAGTDAGTTDDMGTADDMGTDVNPTPPGTLQGSGCACSSARPAADPSPVIALALIVLGGVVRRRRTIR